MASEMEKVVILGVGGGAGRVMRSVADSYASTWSHLAYLDTDIQDLEFQEGVLHVPLGSTWTHGLGCGGDPGLGEKATNASHQGIREVIRDANLVVVLGCLGGGTASGGVLSLARLLRDEKVLTFFFVSMPFANEGNSKRTIAEAALTKLRAQTDVVVAVQNDLLFSSFPADTGVEEAFAEANTILADGLVGIAELIRCRGILPIDFASLRTLLRRRSAMCSFGVGRASGEGRFATVIETLFASPMLGGREFVMQADVVVATLVAGHDLSIGEMNECMHALQQQLGPATRVVTGTNLVDGKEGEVTLTLLAIHYGQGEPEAAPTPVKGAGKAATTTTGKKGEGKGAKGKNMDSTRQFRLPFDEERFSVGCFGNVPPTMHLGENLDIPTFQRRGVHLEEEA